MPRSSTLGPRHHRNAGCGSTLPREMAHRRGGADEMVTLIGLVIGFDIGEAVAIVDHQPGRLLQSLLRAVAEPVEPLDPRPVAEMEMRHRVAGAAKAALLV